MLCEESWVMLSGSMSVSTLWEYYEVQAWSCSCSRHRPDTVLFHFRPLFMSVSFIYQAFLTCIKSLFVERMGLNILMNMCVDWGIDRIKDFLTIWCTMVISKFAFSILHFSIINSQGREYWQFRKIFNVVQGRVKTQHTGTAVITTALLKL